MAGVDDYMRLVRGSPIEVQALFRDRLIPATSFFRDSASFEHVRSVVLPQLLATQSSGDPRSAVRVWVVGCSTGEEVYSLAMIFTEAAERLGRDVPLCISATDLNAAAIASAQTGSYAQAAAQDVLPGRLRRFFREANGAYQVDPALRACCEFTRHNALIDPPLADMDLISCRNLFMYLDEKMQHQLAMTLHGALKQTGRLWLGNTERLDAQRERFAVEDARHGVYVKNPA